MLKIWLILTLVLEVGIVLALGYAALRLVTKFIRMQKDIEELKLAVRELLRRG